MLVVDSRRAEGFDRHLPTSGPLVYTIDTRLNRHDGAVRGRPVGDADTPHWHALLVAGHTVSASHVNVTVVNSDGQGDTLYITRDALPPAN